MLFKTYKVISELIDNETRQKVFDVLEIYNGVLYGRIFIFAAILSLFLVGNYIKGAGKVIELVTSEGVNFFDQHYIIQDYQGNCKTLIDSDYNIIEAKPVQSWRKPSNCIDYSKFQLVALVFKTQLAARRTFNDIFWPYVFIALFYFLSGLHVATEKFYAAPVNVTPVTLCVTWLCIAILLFPVLFRDHKSTGGFIDNGTEYYNHSVYLTDSGELVDCPVTFLGKLHSCSVLDKISW